MVCHHNTRTHVRLLGPCFKTGRCEPFCQHRRQAARYALMLTTDMHNTCILNISAGRKNELETKATSSVLARAAHRVGQPLAFDSRTTDAGLHNKGMHRPRTAELLPRNTGSKRFPPNNFKHFLTLFSKFFASFPHGTCSLSVSRLYLALDEIYHPFGAAISNNPTRQEIDTIPDERKSQTGFSPSMMPCSKRLIPATPENDISIDHNSACKTCRF